MKLGNHAIGLRTRTPRVDVGGGLDGNGNPVRDDLGEELDDVVDVEVRWCLVTPTRRSSENDESEDRTAPMTSGMTLLAPPGTPVDERSVVIWPVTGRVGAGPTLELSGPVWEVDGEPGPWPESVEARLRKST